MGRLASLVLILVGVTACGPDAGPKTTVSVNALRVDPQPMVDLAATSASGEMRFGNATGVIRLDDGTLVVADRANLSLRFLSPEGKLLREVGRKGTGPAEFQMLRWMGRCGTNAIYTWDPRQARLTVFDTLGASVRQFNVATSPMAWSCNGAGEFATLASVKGEAMPSLTAPPVTAELATFRPDGSLLRSFGRIAAGKNRPLAADAAVTLIGNRMYYGEGDSAAVVVSTLEGRVLDMVPLGVAGRRVTPTQYRATVEHTLLGLILAKDRDVPREYMMKIPAPDFLPAFRGLLADRAGAVWAITSPFGDGETVLQGVDTTGTPLGTLRIPRELDVREIGRDYLLAIAEDGEGEQHILVYRISR